MSIFLFGCVRYSDPNKILSLNIKCCLDVIKAVFRDIDHCTVIFMTKCAKQPHIMVQTTLDKYVKFSNISTTTLYQIQCIIHHKQPFLTKSQTNKVQSLIRNMTSSYIAITNDKPSRQHQQPFLPQLHGELHKCMK